jgi:hypothetical protein
MGMAAFLDMNERHRVACRRAAGIPVLAAKTFFSKKLLKSLPLSQYRPGLFNP